MYHQLHVPPNLCTAKITVLIGYTGQDDGHGQLPGNHPVDLTRRRQHMFFVQHQPGSCTGSLTRCQDLCWVHPEEEAPHALHGQDCPRQRTPHHDRHGHRAAHRHGTAQECRLLSWRQPRNGALAYSFPQLEHGVHALVQVMVDEVAFVEENWCDPSFAVHPIWAVW